MNSLDRNDFYNSFQWKTLRNKYIKEHPYCELSLLRGIQKKADVVHHIHKFYSQDSDELKWQLLLDEDNLIALSADVHKDIHGKQKFLFPEQKEYITNKKNQVGLKYLQNGVIIRFVSDKN